MLKFTHNIDYYFYFFSGCKCLLDVPTTKRVLPNPQGPLSSCHPSIAVETTYQEVQEASQPKKRGLYNRFTTEFRASIGRYVYENGVAAATNFFP